MKKRFLSVIVLGAALLSVQAQEGKGGISPEMLGQIKQSYQGTAAVGFELWTFGRAVGCSYPLSHLTSPYYAF